MLDIIQPYLDYFTVHPEWALVIIFLIAMGEALLIIGLFVPSTAVLVGAGVLVGTGHLGFWPVVTVTAVGCIVGDQISYWAGRLFGQRLKTMWPLHLYPQLVAKGEDFVRQHGGKSIAIGRFVPGVKSVVPGIVGMFGMNQLFFVFVNVTSGIVWAFAHVVPGVLIGRGLAFAGELSGRLLVVLLVLLVLLALAGYVIRLAAAGVSPFLNHLLARVSAWARARRGRSWQRFARAVSPGNPRSVMIVLFAAILFTGLVALANLAIRAASSDAVSNIDVSLATLMRESRNAPADELMTVITMMGDTIVLSALALAILVWLVWHKAYRAAWAAGIAIVAAKAFELAMKLGIQRARPTELSYSGASLFSFPSGHATMAAVIFGILAVLVSHSMGRWGRALVYATCAILAVAIAYSRLYLGAHWLSDVLAGLTFGVVMMAAFGVAIEAIPPRRIKPHGLFATALVVFLGAGALHVATGFTRASEMYAVQDPLTLVPVAQWIDKDWEKLPARRIDLAGKPEESFIAQFAGNLDLLAAQLEAGGWSATPEWTWGQSLPYLNPNAALPDLAPRPALHEGLKAKLTLTRAAAGDGEGREVIRIYKTGLAATEGTAYKPIYLVSLTREVRTHGFDLYAIPSPRPASAADIADLRGVLSRAGGIAILSGHERGGIRQDLITASP
ncbi:bifunctional DedA family/phosphatase PAP2 family protein [Aestuariivirga sp.]|uniref:bifunctional DedA family/phosphatase PAP2 family protein n=1 Tax=Aestuariivirga sp. TaxID=2650926 RepID=UPI0025C26DB9|nr:bifunctional DedA family/phosphatase PAP2 family protein [Aestuariivirga sp.]MCA3555167.1 bifunctional DedA family/phosphatase PAP2 family protein [Aestuariivirga sp.]